MLAIDRVVCSDSPRREIGVAGWCAFDDLTPAYDLWVECGGRRTPCLAGLPRPDVAAAVHAEAAAASGFVVRFSVDRRADRARVIGRRAGHDVRLGHIPIDRRLTNDGKRTSHRPAEGPIISILLSASSAHLYHLHRSVESVADQTHTQWELCVTAKGAGDSRAVDYLTARLQEDRRIKITDAPAGAFVMRLDAGDELHPDALMEIAAAATADRQVEVIYSDEDWIDQLGIHARPLFKPEFDIDLLDRKSTRLNSSHVSESRMPSSA